MATKTISLSEDAYERLKALKREGESFSDVVRRLTRTVDLREFHGVLSEESGAEVADAIAEGRARRNEEHERRVERLGDELAGEQ